MGEYGDIRWFCVSRDLVPRSGLFCEPFMRVIWLAVPVFYSRAFGLYLRGN